MVAASERNAPLASSQRSDPCNFCARLSSVDWVANCLDLVAYTRAEQPWTADVLLTLGKGLLYVFAGCVQPGLMF